MWERAPTQASPQTQASFYNGWIRASGPVALLELLRTAARARIVATHVLQGIAHRLLVSVAAVRTVDMAVVVIMVIVIVVAVRTMDMGLLSH